MKKKIPALIKESCSGYKSDKRHVGTKKIARYKNRHPILTKQSVHLEGLTVVNGYGP